MMSPRGELKFREVEHCDEELRLLGLLREVQERLSEALNSLDRTTLESLEAKYIVPCCRAVNQAAEGYLILRRIGMVSASKILVRPVIEAMFFAGAAASDKGFIFRKAYSEWTDDNKLFCQDDASREEAKVQWAAFKSEFLKLYPGYPTCEKKLDTATIARIAELPQFYEVQYRLYCKFTHAALEAIDGHWEKISEAYDTRTVIACVLKMMELLEAVTQAKIPDLSPYRAQLSHPD